MTALAIRPVAGKRDLERFIALPNRLHAGDPSYVAPLKAERRQALSPGKNPLFNYVEAAYWLAWRDGVPVGRISAQVDARLGTVGQFGMIAAEDDPAVFHALFSTAEDWLRAKGKTEAQGPFNLNINEEVGLLVDGFDTAPMLMMGHDRAYVGPRVEAEGYAKVMDLYAYLHEFGTPFPKAAQRIMDRPLPADVVVRHMQWKRYDQEIETVIGIFNDAWAGNWGFLPLGADELDHLAKSLKPLIHERLVWIVEVAGKPAAFGIALPNLNEIIRDLNGELFPFGWAKLLWRLKTNKFKSGRVALMGVRREYGKSFLGRAMPFYIFEQFRREALRRGVVERVELSWVLENNMPMRHMGEALGGPPYKTYRVYSKSLAA